MVSADMNKLSVGQKASTLQEIHSRSALIEIYTAEASGEILFRYRPPRNKAAIFDPLRADGQADGSQKASLILRVVVLGENIHFV